MSQRSAFLLVALAAILLAVPLAAQLPGPPPGVPLVNAYELPQQEIPLLYLIEDFFVGWGDQLADPVFLERLRVKPGSAAALALAKAANAYQATRPTPAELADERRVFETLLNDPQAFGARAYATARDQALKTAQVVHDLKHDLDAAGSSMAGVLLFVETMIRPNTRVSSDNPRGADDSYFEHAAAFCQVARFQGCTPMEAER